jgi:hypothetical protein
LFRLPEGVVSDEPGKAAVRLAASAGLPLDEWQRSVLVDSMGLRSSGKWAAFSVCLIVPRQNGKGNVLEARALAGLFLLEEELIVWTAHDAKTAKEGFRRIVGHISNTPDLRRQVAAIKRGNDDRGIELRSGQRLQFIARNSASGRGFSGDCVILDEAFKLDGDDMAALLPTLSAVPNPQIWYASSAPMASSEQLHNVRKRGLAGRDDRLAFFEWSVPKDADVASPESWAIANPGYPHLIDDDAITAEWNEFSADADPSKFARERCGVPDDPVENVELIPSWLSLVDAGSSIVSQHRLALDVSPDRRWASFGVAGRRGDGRFHVETAHHQPGTSWVLEWAVASWQLRKIPIRIQTGSFAGSFIVPLRERGVEVVEVSSAEHAQALGQLLDACASDGVRHLGQSSLNAAVKGATVRTAGDVDVLGRRTSKVDITPLVAVTLALGGVPENSDALVFAY